MTAPTKKRWLEYMTLDSVLPALRNPKDHKPEVISSSISQFGYIEPIVMDERTGRLVSGHGRLADLVRREQAGEEPPDGIDVDEETGRWVAPVTRGWSSRSDDEAHAAGIAINQGTIAGGFKSDELAELLQEVQAGGIDLAATGFSDAQLDDMLANMGDEIVLEPEDTDAEYAEQTKRGDPAPPRTAQGLHEVGLMFQADLHREYQELLARLRNAWGIDIASSVVLKAMREAVERMD